MSKIRTPGCDDRRLFGWKRIVVFVIAISGVAGYLIFKEQISNIIEVLSEGTLDDVVTMIRGWGVLAPIVSMLLMVLQAFIAPIPSFLITGANGVIFGVYYGILISWAGAMVGAAGTFYLARIFGAAFVRRFENSSNLMLKAQEMSRKHGFRVVLIGRLLPFVSFDFLSYAAGLSTIAPIPFFVATGVGMIPGTIAYVLLGNRILLLSRYSYAATVLVVLGAVVWISVGVVRKRRKKILQDSTPGQRKRLLLVGGGHAHLRVIADAGKFVQNNEVVLISNSGKQYYSGMSSGYLENIYTIQDISVDLSDYCERNRVRFIEDEVVSIDPDNKCVCTATGGTYEFDVISFDIGSTTKGLDEPGVGKYAIPIRPLSNMERVYVSLRESARPNPHILIVGAGTAGVETACALASLTHNTSRPARITVVDSGSSIMQGYPDIARSYCMKTLARYRINILHNSQVVAANDTQVRMASNESLEYDLLIWTTGPSSNGMFGSAGLAVDEQGYLLVDQHLRSMSHPFVFGAGDCVTLNCDRYTPKNGVFAIREARVLAKNVLVVQRETSLYKFRSWKWFLAIISLGMGQAVLIYAGITFKGRWVWRLKDHIDRKYMRKLG